MAPEQSRRKVADATIVRKVEKLRKELRRHDHLYYVLAQPEISDEQYDLLMRELQALEAEYPELSAPDSPTQRVGGEPTKEFPTVTHALPMLSLANAYSEEEIRDFDSRVKTTLGNQSYSYVCELKFDGVSLSLRYRKGLLVRGATRGDGLQGDDITNNVKTIGSIPLRLEPTDENLLNCEVRGEVVMFKEDFERMNKERQQTGEKILINPRNSVAGTLKLQDPKMVRTRPLKFYAYQLHPEGGERESHYENLLALREMGFRVDQDARLCRTIEDVITFQKKIEKRREQLPFDIDGIVVKVDSLRQQKLLGEISKSPRWATAYKFASRRAETKLKGITPQVGRLGTITPVAELEPVFLGGTTISRATLHNFDYISKLKIEGTGKSDSLRIGDTVVVEKGGDVIPQVTAILNGKRGRKPFEVPSNCPECGSALIREKIAGGKKEEVALRCDNVAGCPAQKVRRLEFFAQRNALDIEGLGGAVAEKLVESGLVKEPLDLFDFTVNQLGSLNLGSKEEPRVFGVKNATRIIDALSRSRSMSLARWMYAFGIPSVGETAAIELSLVHKDLKDLADSKKIRDLLELRQLVDKAKTVNVDSPRNKKKIQINKKSPKKKKSQEELGALGEKERLVRQHQDINAQIESICDRLKIAGVRVSLTGPKKKSGNPPLLKVTTKIGPEVVKSVLGFFASDVGRKVLKRLKALRILPIGGQGARAERSQQVFSGKTFVLTGTLPSMTRPEAAEEIRMRGGTVSNSVSKKTSFVIAGEEAGSKLSDAKKLGVRILSETEFLKMVGGGQDDVSNSKSLQGELPL